MHPIHETVKLIEQSLNEGITSVEVVAADKNNPNLLRFQLGHGDQYVCNIEGNEPQAISIARRLLRGNLNLKMVGQEVDASVRDMLVKVDALGDRLYGANRGKESIPRFNDAIALLYVKQVEIYKINPLTSNEDLFTRGSAGEHEALMQLDKQGDMHKVGYLLLADKFDTQNTLRQAHTTVGPDGMWTSAAAAYVEPGLDKELLWSLQGSVLKIDGKAFAGDGAAPFIEMEGFSGHNDATEKRLAKKREFSFTDFNF